MTSLFRSPLRARAVSALAASALFVAVAADAQVIRTLRWAALGDAVSSAGWPARAGARLPADSIINYGHAGGTALRSGDSSYWSSGRLAQVFAYQPDIVSIQLGSADSKPVNWDDSASFANDYKALIDTLRSMPSNPRIIIVYPTPVWKNEAGAQDAGLRRGAVIAGSIIPRLRAIALEKGADTANLHAPLLARQSLFADSVVPAAAGNDTLGRLVFQAFVNQSIRVMCVGNSITFGHGLNAREAYPVSLNKLLGKRYWVWNGGKSGWWMQRAQLPGASASFKSYVTDKAQMDTLFMMKPHYITVKLGTNDARQNFWNTPRFIGDYRHFIDTLYDNMTPKPKIVLMKAFPAWRINGNWAFANNGHTAEANGINGDIIRDSLGPAITMIAASRPAPVAGVIDLHAPFVSASPTLAPDGVHPNKAGMDSLARVVFRELTPIVTSVAPGKASRPSFSGAGLSARVNLAGGRVPEWMAGARILSLDGKAVRVGPAGTLPAGVYFVKRDAALKRDAASTRAEAGKRD